MSASAPLAEVFVSFQGEGPLVGVRQLFVRVRGCDLACRYCDTPAARDVTGPCLIAVPDAQEAGAPDRELGNPFTARRVFEELGPLPPRLHSLALTGGEPLLYPQFVADLAAEARRRGLPLYLETAGHLPEALRQVAADASFIALDFKLPSTLAAPMPQERFVESYAAAQGRPLAVKMVVTDETEPGEVARACEALAGVSERGPLILQPVTPRGGLRAPDHALLERLWRAASGHIADVRVIPQCHRLLGVR